MDVEHLLDRFKLHNYLLVNNEIRTVLGSEFSSFIKNREKWLRRELDLPVAKLDAKCL